MNPTYYIYLSAGLVALFCLYALILVVWYIRARRRCCDHCRHWEPADCTPDGFCRHKSNRRTSFEICRGWYGSIRQVVTAPDDTCVYFEKD